MIAALIQLFKYELGTFTCLNSHLFFSWNKITLIRKCCTKTEKDKAKKPKCSKIYAAVYKCMSACGTIFVPLNITSIFLECTPQSMLFKCAVLCSQVYESFLMDESTFCCYSLGITCFLLFQNSKINWCHKVFGLQVLYCIMTDE